MHQLTVAPGLIDLSALLPGAVQVDWCSEIFETAPAPSERVGTGVVCKTPVAYLVAGHYTTTVSSRLQQSWCCRLLLYQLLQQLHPDGAKCWTVGHSQNGAPQLLLNQKPSTYQLSFSHSGYYCAVALSRETPIGIDIERCGTGRNFAAMSRFLGWQPKDGQETRFLDRWTLHEACAKISARSALQVSAPGFEALSHTAQPGLLRSSGDWRVLQWHLMQQAPAGLPTHPSSHTASAQLSCVLRPRRNCPLAFRPFEWRASCRNAPMGSACLNTVAST